MSPVTEPLQTLARIQEATFARATASAGASFPAERRMDGPALLRFLERKRYGILATVRPDGRPHAAPVGFALVGVRFVIASRADSARVRNLAHEPHASLVVEEGGDDPDAVVMAEGTAQLYPVMEASLEMRAPFRDRDGSMKPWVGTIIAITPERLLSYAAPGFQA